MKKLTMVLAAVTLFAATAVPLFAGGAKKEAAPAGVTVIRVWSDQASEKTLRDAQIARFNEGRGKELGIKIEYTVTGSSGYHDLIRNAGLADDLPEVFRASGEDIEFLVGTGRLAALTDLPGGQAFVDQYQGQLVNQSQIFNNKVYSAPYNMTTFKLIVNKDLFAKNNLAYPKTWAEVRAAAKTITQNGGGTEFGFVIGLTEAWITRTYFWAPMGANTGLNAGWDSEKLVFNYSAALPGLQELYGMVSDGSVFPGIEGLNADAFRARFAEGNIGMTMGASFDVGVYTNQFLAKCDWDVIDVPAFTGAGLTNVDFVDASNLLVVNATVLKNLDMAQKAFEVYKYFYSDENAAEMYEQGLYVPFRVEAVQMAKNPPPEQFQKFANLPAKAIVLPTPENLMSIEGATYRETLLNILARKHANQSLADVLADLDKRANAAAQKLGADRLRANYYAVRDTTKK